MLKPDFWSRLALLALIAIPGATAYESALDAPSDVEVRAEADAVVEHAKTFLNDGSPVFVGDCCTVPLRFTADDFRKMYDRKFYILLPRHQSPLDVRVNVANDGTLVGLKDIQVTAKDNENMSLWFTQVHSTALKRDDYFLQLKIGAFESEAQGQLYQSSYLNWQENNEYRLVAFRAPLDPSDPAFSIILEDEMLVTVASLTNPESLIPSIRPTFSIRPADVGISMSGGRRVRYKVSIGAGYVLSALPFAAPNSATQGFLRLQIRFK